MRNALSNAVGPQAFPETMSWFAGFAAMLGAWRISSAAAHGWARMKKLRHQGVGKCLHTAVIAGIGIGYSARQCDTRVELQRLTGLEVVR